MSRIPFIEARFFNPDETTYTLEKRFVQHLRDLRSRELPDTSAGADSADICENTARRRHSTSPSDRERARIRCRVDLLLERRKAASGIGHLTREHRERLAVLRDGVRLAAIATEHQADELAAELHGDVFSHSWNPARGSGPKSCPDGLPMKRDGLHGEIRSTLRPTGQSLAGPGTSSAASSRTNLLTTSWAWS